ncbi:uncharacterized protein LOC142323427 [Lycorma delicatula]|uniref:uncharacterized protein LOC142323427 n=1 Tax=Lycorma delicatula TaxID=130591 RepID=UPI003F5141C7
MLLISFIILSLNSRIFGEECADINFEMFNGYVMNSGDVLGSRTGVSSVSDCVSLCLAESSCSAFNYETGICILLASVEPISDSGVLAKSQYPVFSIFAKKRCVPRICSGRAWAIEMVSGTRLPVTPKKRAHAATASECGTLCLTQSEFTCRSANYDAATRECAMSELDRFSVNGATEPSSTIEYIESNCVTDPVNMCDFSKITGKILKTVDASIQNVKNVDECRLMCLESRYFRCHSFDYGDTGDGICRLSHHSTGSLQQAHEPYIELPSGSTHQLTACYNVTVHCRSNDMIAKVNTNKLFGGKVYAKTRPNSCVADVKDSLEFELRLGYNDLNCDVKQEAPGKYRTDIIIQHHDQIVRSTDLGLSVRCSYDLGNHSVGHGVELEVSGEPGGSSLGSEETSFVISPTVTMRITDRQGHDIHTAQVGDPLSLRFHILDQDSPYQIFVRELIALDGVDSSEILLVDSLGCPTDPTIMGPISTVSKDKEPQVLEAPFDAFKFPTSDIVQFKALVTPCLPACEPVICNIEDYYGTVRKMDSFGRRKRETVNRGKDEVVMQTIRIEDKFTFPKRHTAVKTGEFEPRVKDCINMTDTIAIGAILLLLQITLCFICLSAQKKKHRETEKQISSTSGIETNNTLSWNRIYRLS